MLADQSIVGQAFVQQLPRAQANFWIVGGERLFELRPAGSAQVA